MHDEPANRSNVVIRIGQPSGDDADADSNKKAPRNGVTFLRGMLGKQLSVDNSHLMPSSCKHTLQAGSVSPQFASGSRLDKLAAINDEMATTRTRSRGEDVNGASSPVYSSASSCTADADVEYDDDTRSHAHGDGYLDDDALKSHTNELLTALTRTMLLSTSQRALPPQICGGKAVSANLPTDAERISRSSSTKCCACQCHHHTPNAGLTDQQSLLLVQTMLPLMLRNSLGSLRKKKKKRRNRKQSHSKSSNALHADVTQMDHNALPEYDDEMPMSISASKSDEAMDRQRDDCSPATMCRNAQRQRSDHQASSSAYRQRQHDQQASSSSAYQQASSSAYQQDGDDESERHVRMPFAHTHTQKGDKKLQMRSSLSSTTDDSLYSRSGPNVIFGHPIWTQQDEDGFEYADRA